MWMMLVVSLAFIGASSALDCFECDGEGCLHQEGLVQKKCEKESKYCLKLILDGEVTRSCAYDDPKGGQPGCDGAGKTMSCFCQGDLCNSSPSFSVSALLLPLLLIPLFARAA